MGKLTALILIVFSAISFILGYNFYFYQNPIKVCEVCKPIVISEKPIVSDKIEELEQIESNGEVADYEEKIRDCWLQFNQVAMSNQNLELINKECENKVSGLESNLSACQIYQADINEYVDKLKQDLKELINSLNICYQQK